jgi:hypothetical protein
VNTIDLAGYEQVSKVVGLADTWWSGKNSLAAIYVGEAECLSAPNTRHALIYSGLGDWGLHADPDQRKVARPLV